MAKQPWTLARLPNLDGRVAIVTGANAGLGYETAFALASAGAEVVLATRDQLRGERAAGRIRATRPQAKVERLELDLSRLDSVAEFVEAFGADHDRLDILVNNAGVMHPPANKTAEGFELQFGVNHLGHHALTGRLLPLLSRAEDPRIVTVSSIAHRGAKIDFDNLRMEKGYNPYREYGQSKLANLVFARELDRRLRAAQSPIRSIAAHPGVSATDLSRYFPRLVASLAKGVSMSPAKGALSQIYACVEDVQGGAYIGPDGFKEIWGWPHHAEVDAAARVDGLGPRLFDVSEQATGVRFELG